LKQYIQQSYFNLRNTNVVSNFFNLSGIQLSNILLLIISIPIITRAIGIEKFGVMMFASRFSQLAGTIVNYGTNQSGIRDIATTLKDKKKLSAVLYNTFYIRIFIFLFYVIFLSCFKCFHLKYFEFIILSIPMVLAEVVNPLFFFIANNKLKVYNIANLAGNIITIIILVVFIKSPKDASWVNFILGSANTFVYIGLLVFIILQIKINYQPLVKRELLKITKDNFYLTANNISVQLQQSIIIFALTTWGNPSLLGAYSLCDRIIGQCRNLVITISNAVYPTSVFYYQQGIQFWNNYRIKLKYLLGGIFFIGSILLFLLADFIISTLSKEHNATAISLLKIMAIVPTIAALNFTNVLDQLLKNNTIYIFVIAVILLLVSLATSYFLLHTGSNLGIGSFTIITEASALFMYELIIRKPSFFNN
jgi:O-antigen/teichoic acid export membrane protein